MLSIADQENSFILLFIKKKYVCLRISMILYIICLFVGSLCLCLLKGFQLLPFYTEVGKLQESGVSNWVNGYH